jgi:hypothetical protein
MKYLLVLIIIFVSIFTYNQVFATTSNDYVIFTNSTGIYAKNDLTGNIDYSGINASEVIQNAINNANVIKIKSGNYILQKTLLIQNPYEQIIGDGIGNTNLYVDNIASISNLIQISPKSTNYPSINLINDINEGSNIITLPTGLGITFSPNDMIWLHDSYSTARQQILQIISVSGDNLILSDIIGDTYKITNNARLQKLVTIPNISISDISLSQSNNTGLTAGLYSSSCYQCEFSHIKISGFQKQGLIAGASYQTKISDIYLNDNAKSGSGYADFQTTTGSSQINILNIISNNAGSGSNGFGPTFNNLHNSYLDNIISNHSGGRGFKLHASSYNTLDSIKVFNSGMGFTGVSITLDSHNNIFHNTISMGNSQGIAIFDGVPGVNSRNNTFIGGFSLNNTLGSNHSDIYNGNIGDIVSGNVIDTITYSMLHNNGLNKITIK